MRLIQRGRFSHPLSTRRGGLWTAERAAGGADSSWTAASSAAPRATASTDRAAAGSCTRDPPRLSTTCPHPLGKLFEFSAALASAAAGAAAPASLSTAPTTMGEENKQQRGRRRRVARDGQILSVFLRNVVDANRVLVTLVHPHAWWCEVFSTPETRWARRCANTDEP